MIGRGWLLCAGVAIGLFVAGAAMDAVWLLAASLIVAAGAAAFIK